MIVIRSKQKTTDSYEKVNEKLNRTTSRNKRNRKIRRRKTVHEKQLSQGRDRKGERERERLRLEKS